MQGVIRSDFVVSGRRLQVGRQTGRPYETILCRGEECPYKSSPGPFEGIGRRCTAQPGVGV